MLKTFLFILFCRNCRLNKPDFKGKVFFCVYLKEKCFWYYFHVFCRLCQTNLRTELQVSVVEGVFLYILRKEKRNNVSFFFVGPGGLRLGCWRFKNSKFLYKTLPFISFFLTETFSNANVSFIIFFVDPGGIRLEI